MAEPRNGALRVLPPKTALPNTTEYGGAMNAEEILDDLRKYDYPRAYYSRFVMFGTEDTDNAATHAAGVSLADLQSKESVTEFLHTLWGYTSRALDHAGCKPEHNPALKQLEVELCNYVTTLRGQVLPRW